MNIFIKILGIALLTACVVSLPTGQVYADNDIGENDSVEMHNRQENGKTRVLGVVRDDQNRPVWKADVSVLCNGSTETTKTNQLGVYLAKFNRSVCRSGDTVQVTATKDGMSGGGSGVVTEYLRRVDLAIVSFAIPEFGLITGALASLGGLGAYLKMRRSV